MKLLSILLLLFLHTVCIAQPKSRKFSPKLYYFETKDSLFGVRDQNKKVIIQPRRSYMDFDLKTPIEDELIWLDEDEAEKHESQSFGIYYDRKGNRLFAPFMYDNGPDGLSEGLMRFVKDGKVGFADDHGKIVIQPNYDYADKFNYGIASYCNGCVWKYKGEERYVIGGKTGFINRKGDSLSVLSVKSSIKDQRVKDSGFIRNQFSYTNFEKSILDSFYRLPEISRAYFVNHQYAPDSLEKQLDFEITERPHPGFPYYHISVYTYDNKYGYNHYSEDMDFLVSENGKNYFYSDGYNEFHPFKQWLRKYINDAKIFLQKHPGYLNKY